MDDIVIPCNSTNSQNLYQFYSVELDGLSSKCVIALFGIVTNIITLIVFYRIKWFKRKQMVFFLITTFTNLLTCLGLLAPSVILIVNISVHEDRMWKQSSCVGIMVPGSAAITSLQRFTLLVAIDRVGAQWFSYQWFRFKLGYKWLTVCFFALWSIIQESMWLWFINSENCVSSCFFGYFVYPDVWWHTVVNVCDFTVTILIFVLFLLVPITTLCRRKSVMQQIKSECFIIQEQNIFLRKRESLARVRLLSFIYVAGFICTTCSGIALSGQYGFNKIDAKTSFYMNDVANLLKNIHLVFSPFIFLIDASFRRELRRCCLRKLLSQ